MEAQYKHDCSRCIFLGVGDSRKGAVDIYWCPDPHGEKFSSILGRYGNEGPEYISWHPPEAFAGPSTWMDRAEDWYLRALWVAHERGFYSNDQGWLRYVPMRVRLGLRMPA